MTFPLGGLPTQSQILDLSSIRQAPFKSVAFTHGGVDLDLTDHTTGLPPCASELWATSTGNLVARLAGDSSERTYAVVAGTVVKGLFVLIKSGSTADCIARQ